MVEEGSSRSRLRSIAKQMVKENSKSHTHQTLKRVNTSLKNLHDKEIE
jgi:hypothetical protein